MFTPIYRPAKSRSINDTGKPPVLPFVRRFICAAWTIFDKEDFIVELPESKIISGPAQEKQAKQVESALNMFFLYERFILPSGLILMFPVSSSNVTGDSESNLAKANKTIVELGLGDGHYVWEVIGDQTYSYLLV